jgi:hypothetical protein
MQARLLRPVTTNPERIMPTMNEIASALLCQGIILLDGVFWIPIKIEHEGGKNCFNVKFRSLTWEYCQYFVRTNNNGTDTIIRTS